MCGRGWSEERANPRHASYSMRDALSLQRCLFWHRQPTSAIRTHPGLPSQAQSSRGHPAARAETHHAANECESGQVSTENTSSAPRTGLAVRAGCQAARCPPPDIGLQRNHTNSRGLSTRDRLPQAKKLDVPPTSLPGNPRCNLQPVGDRPNRFEPRKKKRRRSPYDLLMKPRLEAKRDILKRVSEN